MRNLNPVGPMGLPSTTMVFRLVVNFIPWAIQKMAFYSIKLLDRSIYSMVFEFCNNSAILQTGGSLPS